MDPKNTISNKKNSNTFAGIVQNMQTSGSGEGEVYKRGIGTKRSSQVFAKKILTYQRKVAGAEPQENSEQAQIY